MSVRNVDGDENALNDLFRVLSDEDRRRVLLALARQDGGEDGRRSVRYRGDDAAFDLPQQTLYHVHLPALAEAGYVDWDGDAGVVRAGPRFGTIEGLLAILDDNRGDLPGDWP